MNAIRFSALSEISSFFSLQKRILSSSLMSGWSSSSSSPAPVRSWTICPTFSRAICTSSSYRWMLTVSTLIYRVCRPSLPSMLSIARELTSIVFRLSTRRCPPGSARSAVPNIRRLSLCRFQQSSSSLSVSSCSICDFRSSNSLIGELFQLLIFKMEISPRSPPSSL